MIYYMNSSRAGEDSYWEQCKATTLVGAKREATNEYSGDYRDATLSIAIGDNINEERRILATKPNTENGKWEDKWA